MKFESDIHWIVNIQQTGITGPVYVKLHFVHLLLYFSVSKFKWVEPPRKWNNITTFPNMKLNVYKITAYETENILWQ
jgi:hypothetical protein